MIHSLVYWTVTAIAIVQTKCDSCPPAVVGSAYSFQGEFRHNLQCPLEVLWRRDWTPVSSCRSNMACYDYSDVKTLTTMTSLGGGVYKFNLTIMKVTKHDTRVWALRYLGLASLQIPNDIYTCELQVFDMSSLELQDCPEVVNDGSEASCLCRARDFPDGNITIEWVDEKGNLQNGGEEKLTFTARRSSSGFVCRGRTSTGLENTPLYYKPSITGEPQEKTTKDEVNFTSKKIFKFTSSVILFFLIMFTIVIVTQLCVRSTRNECQVTRSIWTKRCSKSKKQQKSLLHYSQLNKAFNIDDEKLSSTDYSNQSEASRPRHGEENASEIGKTQTIELEIDSKIKDGSCFISSPQIVSLQTLQSQLTLQNELEGMICDVNSPLLENT